MSVLEAMAMEKPVVAYAVGGIPDVIKSEENGLLAPAGDSEVLIQQIQRLIEDPQLRERLGKQAHQDVYTHYNAVFVAQKYEKLYEALV